MAQTPYTYEFTDFPNNAADANRLSSEIVGNPAITKKLIGISISSNVIVTMADVLTPAEETILDATVAAHSGAPLDDAPAQRVSIEKAEADERWFHTVNWCDKTTWWQRSILVENEALQEVQGGERKKWKMTHPFVVCLTQGKLTMEDLISSTYKLHVFVDGVEVTEQLTYVDESMADRYKGDYVCDYRSGEIEFHDAVDPAAVVTATYRYARDSTFSMVPTDGIPLKIQAAEAEFTTDFDMRDTVIYQAFLWAQVLAAEMGTDLSTLQAMLVAQYGGTRDALMTFLGIVDANGDPLQRDLEALDKVPHPTQVRIYKTYWDFRTQSNGNHAEVPAVGGTKRGTRVSSVTHPFDYRTNKNLRPSYGLEARIWLKDHVEFGREATSLATATFYCIAEE